MSFTGDGHSFRPVGIARERRRRFGRFARCLGVCLASLMLVILTADIQRSVRGQDEMLGNPGSESFSERRPVVWLALSVAELQDNISRLSRLVGPGRSAKNCIASCEEEGGSRSSSSEKGGNMPSPGEPGFLTKDELNRAEADFRRFKENVELRSSALEEVSSLKAEQRTLEQRDLPRLERLLAKAARDADPKALANMKPDAKKGTTEEDVRNDKLKREQALESAQWDVARAKQRLVEVKSSAKEREAQLKSYDAAIREASSKKYGKERLTLLEQALMQSDTDKSDWLIRQEGAETLGLRLVRAARASEPRQVAELLRMGAGVTGTIQQYSALAWAEALGLSRVKADLKACGAMLEVPWASTTRPPLKADNDFLAIQNQLERVSRYSASVRHTHPGIERQIRTLRCKLNCLRSRIALNTGVSPR